MPTFVGLCGVESTTGALRARELQSLHYEDVTVLCSLWNKRRNGNIENWLRNCRRLHVTHGICVYYYDFRQTYHDICGVFLKKYKANRHRLRIINKFELVCIFKIVPGLCL